MFGWGSSKKLSPRDIQIDQLKKTFPSLHETARGEDNVFDISSRTHGGTNFTIRVFLRKAFPADKPVILVYTPPGCEFSHPSVDAKTNEICGMEKLNRWHPNTSLVEIVNDALILVSRYLKFADSFNAHFSFVGKPSRLISCAGRATTRCTCLFSSGPSAPTLWIRANAFSTQRTDTATGSFNRAAATNGYVH